MTKTSLDTCTQALRHIAVCGVDEAADPADVTYCKAHLVDIHATLSDTQELALDWTIETIPDGLFLPLAIMLSGSIAPTYSKTNFMSEYKRGLGLVRDYEMTLSKVDGRIVATEYF